MADREKLVEQKIKGGAESICAKCFHNKVCKAMDNQPCVECNQLVDANGVTVQEWISVKDRLPPPYTPVLTYRQSFGKNPPYIKVDQMALLYGDDKVWTDDLGTWKTVVTHWMPLPEAPKGE